jgi:2-polyprenyl-3-methyl-5-hydroxy-6-metoxy-1,4-benzoquinol methylase
MSHERAYEMADYERWARNTYRQVKAWLPADCRARILDAACGHGNVLFMLQMYGYQHIEGVDLSEEQVALARQVADSVHQGDVLGFLAARKDAYDTVVAFDLIEHFRKQEVISFLQLARDSLRPGGQLILQTPNAASPFGCEHRYHDFTHEIAFTPASLAHVLRLSGFQDIQFQETGPTVHGVRSAVRWVIWHSIRSLLQVWNLAETGAPQSTLTRVFRARATRA